MERNLGHMMTVISELICEEHEEVGDLLGEFRLNCAEFGYKPNCEPDDEPCSILRANELLTRSTLDHLIVKIQNKNDKIKKMSKIYESLLNIVLLLPEQNYDPE